MTSPNLYGFSAANLSKRLRYGLPRAKIIATQIEDKAVWDALSEDPTFKNASDLGSVIASWHKRADGKKTGPTIYIFGYHHGVVIHMRPKSEMQNIINTATIKAVMES